MYLNNTIVHFFEMRAGARGYQTLTNEALTKVVQRHDLEELLRRVIREELSDSKREPA